MEMPVYSRKKQMANYILIANPILVFSSIAPVLEKEHHLGRHGSMLLGGRVTRIMEIQQPQNLPK